MNLHLAGRNTRSRATVAALLGTGALVLPVVNAAAALTAKTTTRKLVGSTAQADRWGTVQTVVTIKTTVGTNGKKTLKYTDLGGSYTYHTSRSQYIMSQSLPILRQEFLAAQSANIQNISGATFTSQAFEQSVQAALLKASK